MYDNDRDFLRSTERLSLIFLIYLIENQAYFFIVMR